MGGPLGRAVVRGHFSLHSGRVSCPIVRARLTKLTTESIATTPVSVAVVLVGSTHDVSANRPHPPATSVAPILGIIFCRSWPKLSKTNSWKELDRCRPKFGPASAKIRAG